MSLSAATQIGPYEIVSTLGAGAMGEVYVALDTRLNRNVALKIISPGSSDDAARRRRFEAEARAASSLNHPNIITVHDFGTADGISYIVSELVDGESLRSLIQRGPVPIRQLIEIALQIADGLSAAHEAGIVHRDLKPENVMVSKTGRVKILDFGLAKPALSPAEPNTHATIDSLVTEPGLILGTVGYMSPEQARGESVTVASDQFSFGAILHEMASGLQAFKRDTPMQTLLAIANVDHVPFTPGPVGFRMLVERCLSKYPGQRFESTQIIHDKLRKIYDELPQPAGPSKTPEEQALESSETPIIETSRRPRALTSALLAAILAFAAGLLVAKLVPNAQKIDAFRYRFSPLGAGDALQILPRLSPSGQSVAYSQPVDGVFQIFTRRLSGSSAAQQTKSTEDCFRPFWSPDGSRLYYLSGGDLWAVSEAGGAAQKIADRVRSADISPAGTPIAFSRPDANGSESLWLLENGGPLRRIDLKTAFSQIDVQFSPDGKRLGLAAVDPAGSSGIWVLPLGRTSAERQLRAPVFGFSWMPDSNRILFGRDHLRLSDTQSGRVRELTLGVGQENWPTIATAASDDGRVAVFSSTRPRFALHAIALGSAVTALNLPRAALNSEMSPAWNASGSQFAFVTTRPGAPEIRLRDARSGWERVLIRSSDFPEETLAFSGLVFSPDSRHLAFTRSDAAGYAVWVAGIDGEKPVRIAAGRSPVWSRDGNSLVFSSVHNGEPVLSSLRIGSPAPPTVLRQTAAMPLGWSNDGARLLTLQPDGGLTLLTNSGSRSQQAGEQTWLAATWSKNGTRIIGLRRSREHHLELASMTPDGVDEHVEKDLGACPASVSAAAALRLDPVNGFRLSPDGNTVLMSLIDIESGLWRMQGL